MFIHFCRVYSRNTEQISFPDFSSFFLSRLLCLMNAGRANREPHTKMDLQDTLLGVRLFCMRALILVIVKRGSIWCCLPLSMWSMWRQKDLCQMNRGYKFCFWELFQLEDSLWAIKLFHCLFIFSLSSFQRISVFIWLIYV